MSRISLSIPMKIEIDVSICAHMYDMYNCVCVCAGCSSQGGSFVEIISRGSGCTVKTECGS